MVPVGVSPYQALAVGPVEVVGRVCDLGQGLEVSFVVPHQGFGGVVAVLAALGVARFVICVRVGACFGACLGDGGQVVGARLRSGVRAQCVGGRSGGCLVPSLGLAVADRVVGVAGPVGVRSADYGCGRAGCAALPVLVQASVIRRSGSRVKHWVSVVRVVSWPYAVAMAVTLPAGS